MRTQPLPANVLELFSSQLRQHSGPSGLLKTLLLPPPCLAAALRPLLRVTLPETHDRATTSRDKKIKYNKDTGPNRVYMIENWHGSGTGQNVLLILIGSDWNERTLTLRPDRDRKSARYTRSRPLISAAPDRAHPGDTRCGVRPCKNTAELEIKLYHAFFVQRDNISLFDDMLYCRGGKQRTTVVQLNTSSTRRSDTYRSPRIKCVGQVSQQCIASTTTNVGHVSQTSMKARNIYTVGCTSMLHTFCACIEVRRRVSYRIVLHSTSVCTTVVLEKFTQNKKYQKCRLPDHLYLFFGASSNPGNN